MRDARGVDLAGSGLKTNTSRLAFVAELDANGIETWRTEEGTGSGPITAEDVATTAAGEAVMIGTVEYDIDGQGPVPAAGGKDAYFMQFDLDGTPVFTSPFGTPQDDWGREVLVDENDAIWLLWSPNGTAPGQTSKGQGDIFVMRSSQPPGIVQLGTSDIDEAWAMASDGKGHVFVVGSTGDNGVLLARIDNDMTVNWQQVWKTAAGASGGRGVAVAPNGDVLIGGYTNAAIPAIGAPLAGVDKPFSMFVARINPANGFPW